MILKTRQEKINIVLDARPRTTDRRWQNEIFNNSNMDIWNTLYSVNA